MFFSLRNFPQTVSQKLSVFSAVAGYHTDEFTGCEAPTTTAAPAALPGVEAADRQGVG